MAFVFQQQREIVLFTILIIKNTGRLILDNFGIVVSFSAVYQWIRLTSLFILIVFWDQKPQNILFWTFY
jgi:hypothetical protein